MGISRTISGLAGIARTYRAGAAIRVSSPPRHVHDPTHVALISMTSWLNEVQWNEQGLVPCVAEDVHSGRPLMLAWMNREALELTAREGRAVYWSRSRRCLWRKGEQSGHEQRVREIRLDCDADSVALVVEQVGGIACHTGRERCFYRRLEDDRWVDAEPVLMSPDRIYGGR